MIILDFVNAVEHRKNKYFGINIKNPQIITKVLNFIADVKIVVKLF